MSDFNPVRDTRSDTRADSPRQRAYLAGVREAMQAADVARMPPVDATKAELFAKLDAMEQGSRTRPIPMGVRQKGRRAVLAGMLTGLAAITIGVIAYVQRDTAPSVGYTYREYTTHRGQRATLDLPDGSRVMLAPGTTVRVAGEFGRESRVLSLEGEAFFDIAAESGAPFVVRSGAVETRVLGTAFGVRRYGGDSVTQVAVVAGKVAVGPIAAPQRHVTLVAGNVAVATDSSATLRPSDLAVSHVEWTNGNLTFKATPLSVVLDALSNWYGYRFQLADSSLVERRITGTFDVNASTETLQVLRRVLRVSFTVHDSVIVVHPAQSLRHTPAVPKNNPNVIPPSLEFGK